MSFSLKHKAHDINSPFVIALDGPSAAGKGRIGQMLAKKFALLYFQSSIVYRGLAALCQARGIDPNDEELVIELSKDVSIAEFEKNPELGNELIGGIASQIAAIAGVRENLNKHLIQLIKNSPRILMEGRDIGTVIAPDADLKIFLTADIATRAERRYKQLIAEGKNAILPEILNQLRIRDVRDQERAVAPLVPAAGALVIDTSKLMPKRIVEIIVKFINSK